MVENKFYEPSIKLKDLQQKTKNSFDTYISRLENAVKEINNRLHIFTHPNILEKLTCLVHENKQNEIQKLPQEFLEITDHAMEDIYKIGCDYFERENYSTASDIFLLLAVLNPFISTFWIALARTEEKKECFESAQYGYMMGLGLMPSNLELMLDIAECCIQLNLLDRANIYIDELLKETRNNPQYALLNEKAHKLNKKIN